MDPIDWLFTLILALIIVVVICYGHYKILR